MTVFGNQSVVAILQLLSSFWLFVSSRLLQQLKMAFLWNQPAVEDMSLPAAAQTWSFRVPSPPRIFVPPPALFASKNSEPKLLVSEDGNNGTALGDGLNFLATVNLPHFQFRGHVMDWKYEERRMAQEILPFIYLGPVSAARDRTFLQKVGITMVLAVRTSQMSTMNTTILAPRAPRDLGLDTINIEIDGSYALIPAFKQAIERINAHLAPRYQSWQASQAIPVKSDPQVPMQLPGKVLVFCESGNEKSAAVVAAYIMAMYRVDLVQASQIVQSQRFCVSIDDATRHILQAFQDVLEANRDIRYSQIGHGGGSDIGPTPFALGPRHCESTSRAQPKRSIDQAYEDHEMVDSGGSQGDVWLEKRAGVAPFEEVGSD